MATFVKAPCDEGVIRSGAKASPCAPQVGVWVLVATILGSSMAFIDGSVVNVALPVIQQDLGASATDVQWIVETYALFLSSLILVGGSLGDLYGRRRIFALGIAVFTLSSIWCGLSPTVLSLILARAVQGIGAALLVPGSLAIISASFSEEQRGRAFGTWSGFSALTTVVGPVLGGVLVQYARLSLGLLSQCPAGGSRAGCPVLARSRESRSLSIGQTGLVGDRHGDAGVRSAGVWAA